MIQVLAPAFGILFFYVGVLMEKAKRNWFIGTRTPWTLSNDKVWKRTHDVGGKLFKASGMTILFGAFFPDYFLFFVFVPLAVTVVYTTFFLF